MTITADPAREALAAPALRRSLAALVRRRVPASDAEDVAQTILCDALAAPTLPSDPEDLRRFVGGIARHKVADFHRRAGRHRRCEASIDASSDATSDDAPSGAADDLSVEPAPFEARALLSRIATSLARSDREQQTLEWLVREHAGEQLQTIARDEGLPAPAVRQRVSRLRRVLRAQWAHALIAVLVFGSCAVAVERAREAKRIAPDPAGEEIASIGVAANGHWRVERIVSAGDAPHDAIDGIDAFDPRMVDVEIAGRRVDIVVPGRGFMFTIGAASRQADGSFRLRLEARDVTNGARATNLTASIEANRIVLTIHDGRLRGRIELVRR